jgi:outer membrane protein OmpA-like peptidoglycan-associated protein
MNIRKRLIEEFKLEPNKIMAVGHGEESPIASNNNYQGRRLNRRVELRIYRK